MSTIEALQVLLLSMTPIGELRLSIPFGVYALGMPWFPVLLISLIGNIVPALVLVPSLERLSQFLATFPNPLGRLLTWRATSMRRLHTERFAKYGLPFLTILVAIPLPLTGAWSGAFVAWAFQIPFRTAIPFIALGIVIAGVIVTLLTLTGEQARVLLQAR